MAPKKHNNIHLCPTCGESDRDNFYPDNRRHDGLQTYCKECSREKKKQWAAENRDATREASARYRASLKADPERWTEYLRERARRNYLRRITDQVVTANRRAREYQVKGRITTKEWRKMVRTTEVCPACQEPWSLVGRPILDHIISLSRRGKNSIENIQPLCTSCHARKIIAVRRFTKKKKDREDTKTASKRSKKVARQ